MEDKNIKTAQALFANLMNTIIKKTGYVPVPTMEMKYSFQKASKEHIEKSEAYFKALEPLIETKNNKEDE